MQAHKPRTSLWQYLRDRWRQAAQESYGFDVLVTAVLLLLTWYYSETKEVWKDARSVLLGIGALVAAHYLVRVWRTG